MLAEMIFALNNLKSRLPNFDRNISPSLVGIEGYNQLVKAHAKLAEARGEYSKSLDKLTETVRNWRGDDPVSKLYDEVFTGDVLVEPVEEKATLIEQWEVRLRARRPPGYRDGSKDDTGIGDFLIWKSLLQAGGGSKKDLIFVTGEEKSDWFVRSGKEPIYPRPELVDEYREASSGQNIRLCSLYQVLREMNVAEKVLNEVRTAETEANTAISVSRFSSRSTIGGSVQPKFSRSSPTLSSGSVGFDYSTQDGQITIPSHNTEFLLRFSGASRKAVYFYKGQNVKIARVKLPISSQTIDISDLESSSSSYRIGLNEAFVAQNKDGAVLVGVIENIRNEVHGDERDLLEFRYAIDEDGHPIVP
jgi:hypothetical protein